MPAAKANKHTMIGIRMPLQLRKRIKAAAAAEGRNESGFARYHLSTAAEKTLERHLAKHPQ
jgi:uncharacterized protein (DUF1778 family)